MVLPYAGDLNLIGEQFNIRTVERDADMLLNACKNIDLAVNIGKSKFNSGENKM